MPSVLAQWLSGGMLARVPLYVVSAFLEVWVVPDKQPVSPLPKQLYPLVWITALRNQCPLSTDLTLQTYIRKKTVQVWSSLPINPN